MRATRMENNGGAAVTAPISFGYRSTASLRLLLLPPLPSSTADIAAASVCCRRLLRLLRLLRLRLLRLRLPPLCPAARSIAANNMQHMAFWVVTARRRRRKKRLAAPITWHRHLMVVR